MKLDDMIAP